MQHPGYGVYEFVVSCKPMCDGHSWISYMLLRVVVWLHVHSRFFTKHVISEIKSSVVFGWDENQQTRGSLSV